MLFTQDRSLIFTTGAPLGSCFPSNNPCNTDGDCLLGETCNPPESHTIAYNGTTGQSLSDRIYITSNMVLEAVKEDDSFVETARQRLSSNADFSDRWELDEGTLDDLPYGENTFDFVLCRGVIHHVKNDQKALNEIRRVLKVGGRSYLYVTGRGGLLNRFFKELLRDEYQNNMFAQQIVDKEFSEKWCKDQIDCLLAKMEDDGTPSYQRRNRLPPARNHKAGTCESPDLLTQLDHERESGKC